MVTTVPDFDPVPFAFELQEQIASGNRSVGFLFGAGSSIASGLPDLIKLTGEVQDQLTGNDKKCFEEIRGVDGNLETVLNKLRALSEILGGTDSFHGLTESSAKKLDSVICELIYKIIAAGDPKPSAAHLSFAQWVQHAQRSTPVEVFTSNY